MSILIGILGLLGIAVGSGKMISDGYKEQRDDILRDPKHTQPNIFSPGYSKFQKDFDDWDKKAKIYNKFCDEVQDIWGNKVREMVSFSGGASEKYDGMGNLAVYLEALHVGSNVCFEHGGIYAKKHYGQKYNYYRYKIHAFETLSDAFFDSCFIEDVPKVVPVSLRIHKEISCSIPKVRENIAIEEPDYEACIFRGYSISTKNGYVRNNLSYNTMKETFLLDRGGNYSKTIGDFVDEAVFETKMLRKKYEEAGFKFPQHANEYSYFSKWMHADYTKYNT